MTAAIDRLERKGLLERRPNPNDRRGSLVQLTDEGLATIDAAMVVHTEVEHRLLSGLGERQRSQLTGLLRALLLSVEPF
jgi:DNA-binding MarR family transcriptional regulator